MSTMKKMEAVQHWNNTATQLQNIMESDEIKTKDNATLNASFGADLMEEFPPTRCIREESAFINQPTDMSKTVVATYDHQVNLDTSPHSPVTLTSANEIPSPYTLSPTNSRATDFNPHPTVDDRNICYVSQLGLSTDRNLDCNTDKCGSLISTDVHKTISTSPQNNALNVQDHSQSFIELCSHTIDQLIDSCSIPQSYPPEDSKTVQNNCPPELTIVHCSPDNQAPISFSSAETLFSSEGYQYDDTCLASSREVRVSFHEEDHRENEEIARIANCLASNIEPDSLYADQRATKYENQFGANFVPFQVSSSDYVSLFELGMNNSRSDDTSHTTPDSNQQTESDESYLQSRHFESVQLDNSTQKTNRFFKSETDTRGVNDPSANTSNTCQICGKSGFSTKGNLKRHINAHSGEKPYECDHCGAKFTEKKSLKIHFRKHTGEKPYMCEICEKTFSQSGVLKSHKELHLEERKFECPRCPKVFRQGSQLKIHLMRHDGIKNLKCPECDAKFLTRGDLDRHIRTHTGERPFICNICSQRFTRQQSLNEHQNRHNGRKPFQCKYCARSFSEMSACYKHEKSHKFEKIATKSNERTRLVDATLNSQQ